MLSDMGSVFRVQNVQLQEISVVVHIFLWFENSQMSLIFFVCLWFITVI